MWFSKQTTHPLVIVVMLMASILAISPATLAFGSGKDVLKDCADNGQIDGKYTQKEYEEALNKVQADEAQYGACGDIIRDAQQRAAKNQKNNGNNTSTNKQSPNVLGSGRKTTQQGLLAKLPPQTRQKVEQLQKGSAPPPAAQITGAKVTPSLSDKKPKFDKLKDLPAPAVGLLGVLGFGLLGHGFTSILKVVTRFRQ